MPSPSTSARPQTVSLDARPLRAVGAAVLGLAALRPAVGDVGIPCPLRSITGLPCPFCGMTRGVTSTVRGNVGDAMIFNPGSVLLVVAAIALLVMWRRPRVTFPAWLPVVLIAGIWAFELAKYATGSPL